MKDVRGKTGSWDKELSKHICNSLRMLLDHHNSQEIHRQHFMVTEKANLSGSMTRSWCFNEGDM